MSKPQGHALQRYLSKLERRAPVSAEARLAFLATKQQRKELSAYKDIVREGDRPARVCFVESGMVSRYKTLRNGSRQIMSFHIDGDAVDLQSALVMVADHGVRTHAPTIIVTVAHADILDLAAHYPELGRAFWFDTLVDAAIFREWVANVGRRNAHERTAHLLLELAALHQAAGLLKDETFEFPITQSDFADAVGMTAVHLNRVFQWMRREGLIRTQLRTLTIANRVELTSLAGFDPTYLHTEGPRPDALPDGHFIDVEDCPA